LLLKSSPDILQNNSLPLKPSEKGFCDLGSPPVRPVDRTGQTGGPLRHNFKRFWLLSPSQKLDKIYRDYIDPNIASLEGKEDNPI
jgi:hypothetical protein